MSESALQAREDETRQSGHGYSGTPQRRASFVRCSSQTPHVTSPQSRHLPTRGLRASQHRRNTTSLRENFDPRVRWRNGSAPRGSCHGSGIIRARINTRTSQWSAPTMKTTMEEAGRRHGARRQKRITTAVAVVTGRSRTTAARAGRIRGDRVNKANNDHATAAVVPNVIFRCYQEGQGC